MKVLNREFSKKFDEVYRAVLQNCKVVQFRPMSKMPNPYLRRVKGLRDTEQQKEDRIVVIYLQENLEDEEMERVAVHELCHDIIRNQGFDFKFRVNVSLLKKQIEEKLQRKISEEELASNREILDEVFTYIYDSFVHVPLNSCIKRFGYDIEQPTRAVLKEIRQRIIKLKSIDKESPLYKERLFQEAIVYLQEKYSSEYSLGTINLPRLEDLYKKLNPDIQNMAKKIMTYIPEVNLLEPKGCYSTIKSPRDAYGKEIGIPNFSSLMELQNPWTKEVE